MPSQVHKRGPTTPEMNITPLIDVVFQLIIFFMLVNNIVSDEIVEMVVPNLEDPKTQEMAEDNRIIVSVAPRDHQRGERGPDPLMFDGTAQFVQVGSNEEFSMNNMEGVTGALQRRRGNNEDVKVLLRADTALRYEEVQPVMAAITAAGIETVHLVAYMPGEAPQLSSRPTGDAAYARAD